MTDSAPTAPRTQTTHVFMPGVFAVENAPGGYARASWPDPSPDNDLENPYAWWTEAGRGAAHGTSRLGAGT
jgi:hypothetical protein